MSKPIRVRERHYGKESEPFYDIYVRGQPYIGFISPSRLNEWIGHAITHVRGVQSCE